MTVPPPAILRAHVEQARADELEAIERADDRQRPPGWHLSPWAVVSFVIGGRQRVSFGAVIPDVALAGGPYAMVFTAQRDSP